MDEYEVAMRSSLGRGRRAHEEQVVRGRDGVRRRRMEADAEFEFTVGRMVRSQREETAELFETMRREAESDIDDLQRERNALPWD